MRHGKRGRKLGRTASHRRATMNNMAAALFTHGMIRTTKPKAKELRGVAERLITFAKRGDLHSRRQVLRRIRNKVVVAKLFDEIAPTFADRQGGYTRILCLGPRRGDATEVCLIELVGSEVRSDFADTVSSRSAPAAQATAVSAGETDSPDAAAVEAPVTEAAAEADGGTVEDVSSDSDAVGEASVEETGAMNSKSEEDEKT